MATPNSISYITHQSSSYLEALLEEYLQNPDHIDPSWKIFFDGLTLSQNNVNNPNLIQKSDKDSSLALKLSLEFKVIQLIHAYQQHGHLCAKTNPLFPPLASHPLLDLKNFQIKEQELNQIFFAPTLIDLPSCSLKELIASLQKTYCGTIGFEPSLKNTPEKLWLEKEVKKIPEALSLETQKHIWISLAQSEIWERFLHTRYVAQKRFSLEGAESTLVVLNAILEQATQNQVQEAVIGMAHRGRLNILRNLFKKPDADILIEFENNYNLSHAEQNITGDVKYHMGYSSEFVGKNGATCHLSLAYNPSHLEFVNPVVQGMAYAKQQKTGPGKVLPIIIHGDASFAGQGVCYETLTLSQLKGYSTQGSIHIVINNQIGFTTDPFDTRSSEYPTDIMKMIDAPVFHVNADDPEAVWKIGQLCTRFRQEMKKDICINLIGYRRHGHNESDEPQFTQPLLYKKIKEHPTVVEQYAKNTEKALSASEKASVITEENNKLSEAQKTARKEEKPLAFFTLKAAWKDYHRPTTAQIFETIKTRISQEKLLSYAKNLFSDFGDFEVNAKLQKLLASRKKSIEENTAIDWGSAETLSYASLLDQGISIRLSGQDVQRGTFSHRHCVLHHATQPQTLTPLNQMGFLGHFDAVNSPLSETAVLGFEYGIASSDPQKLIIWEAQFGDFSNGAQVIIDQFIASCESKWQRMNGITLFLPHGYEGQGPEHSSARIERFLQQSGLYNWSVCNLTTPAQIFHCLRRQALRSFRKPLIIFTPKSLLRHPLAVSKQEDLTEKNFELILDDPLFPSTKDVKRVLLCSGKIYYDLLQKQTKDIAVIRLEQLYPFPKQTLLTILSRYPQTAQIVWVQEEPQNMGVWNYLLGIWTQHLFPQKLHYLGKTIASAPAVGSHKWHEMEQQTLIQTAFSENIPFFKGEEFL